jgi:nucleoside-diphosphate-sugar epimerase
LIDAAAVAGAQWIVLVSSLGVYDAGSLKRGSLLNESTPLDPAPHLRDLYSYSKIRQEQAARELRGQLGLPLVIVRPGVILGPGRNPISNRVGLRSGGMLIRMGGRQQLPYTSTALQNTIHA